MTSMFLQYKIRKGSKNLNASLRYCFVLYELTETREAREAFSLKNLPSSFTFQLVFSYLNPIFGCLNVAAMHARLKGKQMVPFGESYYKMLPLGKSFSFLFLVSLREPREAFLYRGLFLDFLILLYPSIYMYTLLGLLGVGPLSPSCSMKLCVNLLALRPYVGGSTQFLIPGWVYGVVKITSGE
jgi:hypothetical protein